MARVSVGWNDVLSYRMNPSSTTQQTIPLTIVAIGLGVLACHTVGAVDLTEASNDRGVLPDSARNAGRLNAIAL